MMKKLRTVFFAFLMLVLFALPAGAAGRAELDAEERDLLDTFFSNFAEAYVKSFVVEAWLNILWTSTFFPDSISA